MTTKDVFGLIVRITGLALAVSGLRAVPLLHGVSALDAVLIGIPYILVTLYLLRGAPRLMAFSYPPEKRAVPERDGE